MSARLLGSSMANLTCPSVKVFDVLQSFSAVGIGNIGVGVSEWQSGDIVKQNECVAGMLQDMNAFSSTSARNILARRLQASMWTRM